MKLSRRQWLVGGAGAAAAFGSWWWMSDATSSRQEITAMQTYTEQMKTCCVGRFLIDVPASAQVSLPNCGIRIANIQATPRPHQAASALLQLLDADLQKRVTELRSQPRTFGGRERFLGSWQGGAAVRVLYYLPEGMEPLGKAAGYVARDSGIFEFQTNANQPADAKELLDFLVEIEPALTMLVPGELPRSPGFCIGNGLVAINPKRGENVNGWNWSLTDHPDLVFGLSSRTNGDKVEPGLVDREGSILEEAGAWYMKRVRTLRKRRFEIGTLPAQEWSIEITDSAPEYQFDLEIPGRPNDNACPFITLGMRVGGTGVGQYRKPSLTTGEALALWDAVIPTLRLRPGAF